MEPTLPDTTGLLAPGFMDGSAQFGLALLLGHSRRHLDITHHSPPQEMEVGLETQVSLFPEADPDPGCTGCASPPLPRHHRTGSKSPSSALWSGPIKARERMMLSGWECSN